MRPLLNVLLFSLAATAVPAEKADPPKEPNSLGSGHVQIPLDVYNELIASARGRHPRQAPSGYALGNARVVVTVPETEPARVLPCPQRFASTCWKANGSSFPSFPQGLPSKAPRWEDKR